MVISTDNIKQLKMSVVDTTKYDDLLVLLFVSIQEMDWEKLKWVAVCVYELNWMFPHFDSYVWIFEK